MQKPDLTIRELTSPYEFWSDKDWLKIPYSMVPIDSLVPTQIGLSLYALVDLYHGADSESGDFAGRVIRYMSKLYLYDGHHRWVIAYLRGDSHFPVRIVDGM